MGGSHHRAGLVFIGVCIAIGVLLFAFDRERATVDGWVAQRPGAAASPVATARPVAAEQADADFAPNPDHAIYTGPDSDDTAQPAPAGAAPEAPAASAPDGAAGTGGSAEADARAFADAYFREGGSGADEAMPWLGQHYGETVDFFGKVTPRSAVLSQKAKFIRRWPDRSYSVEPATVAVACRAEQQVCRTSGIVDWTAASAERGARSSGRAAFTLITASGGGEPQIVSEDSHVIARGAE